MVLEMRWAYGHIKSGFRRDCQKKTLDECHACASLCTCVPVCSGLCLALQALLRHLQQCCPLSMLSLHLAQLFVLLAVLRR